MIPHSSSCGTITSGHELHGLKLGAGERTTQQSEADAQDRVDDRDDEHPQGAAGGVEAEQPERHDARHAWPAAAAATENAVP